MNRILVYAPAEDQRGRAVWLAAALARRTGAELTLVRVLEESMVWSGQDEIGAAKLKQLLIETETRELVRLADSLRTSSNERIRIDTEVHWGVPWEVVIALVEQRGFDLVVKPARGLSHSGRVFFGATALHLFRRCPCPVWVVGDDGHPPQRILLSIDPSLDAPRKSMASKLFGWGEWVRSACQAELEVVSAWQAPGAELLKTELEPAEFDRYVRDAREQAESGLQTMVDEAAPSTCVKRVNLLSGSARDVIPAFAEDQEFDLVVVGTLGRTGIAGELLGETAETILRGVRCSVLAVAPRHRQPASHAD
ncbi:MAG: universal stress protein [Deltaproteobacteria bacterium]|nr:universal stress protein [Deltaproteobacteria bacterium]